ncbi:hypothetical protein MsAg5_04020 [Methanosarcinaceae archaeon Ag5]|uniref:Uncharacterized protein n=1 Tax=Methanolapillus africanus TaxID=3028297 RepID=A0AAE4SCJ1_9EURY|nr:hypothetical protein [Methanosarcinaceae archaeon Ag5]
MSNTQEKIFIAGISLLLMLGAVVLTALVQTHAIDPEWTLSPDLVQVDGPAGFHYINTREIFYDADLENASGTQTYSAPFPYFIQNVLAEFKNIIPVVGNIETKTLNRDYYNDTRYNYSEAILSWENGTTALEQSPDGAPATVAETEIAAAAESGETTVDSEIITVADFGGIVDSTASHTYPGYSGFYLYVTYREQTTPFTAEFWKMPASDILLYFSKPDNWMKGPGENPDKVPNGFAYVNVVAADSPENASLLAADLAARHYARSGEQDRAVIKAAVNSMPGYRYSYTYTPDAANGGVESGGAEDTVTAAGYIWTVDNFLVTVDGYNVDSKPLKLLAKSVRFDGDHS